MEFDYIPFGNAKEITNDNGTYSFVCQHGTEECSGNMFEACAIEHNNATFIAGHIPIWWSFVSCLESQRNPGSAGAAKRCAKMGSVEWDVIKKCAGTDTTQGSTTDGNLIMHALAQETLDLDPPHQWTPWIVLNGVPLTQDELDLQLKDLVCKAYQGSYSGCN